MNIRNRMPDVVKLRCNACQDFLKMVIKDGWQQVVYDKAKNEINGNGRFKSKYADAYTKMREEGIDNYTIDDMDVTFISEVVHGCRSIAPIHDKTRTKIEQLTEDRNITDHSHENEDPEELYLRGLLALLDLEKFVITVDRYETSIDDEKRIEFIRTYKKQIEDLKNTLDEERITLVQKKKEIIEDVQQILNCKDEKQRQSAWFEVGEKYMRIASKDPDRYGEFAIAASDAGIKMAHSHAANYLFRRKKDYEEFERRLYMLYNAYDPLSAIEAHNIVDDIRTYLKEGNSLTDGMDKLVKLVIEQGYPVEKDEEGIFYLPLKREYK